MAKNKCSNCARLLRNVPFNGTSLDGKKYFACGGMSDCLLMLARVITHYNGNVQSMAPYYVPEDGPGCCYFRPTGEETKVIALNPGQEKAN